ncbi:Mitochondrial distribution and morphology protein 12 [Apiospora rasikravindrae]|uniref:Mitochondrial distribution and morphology protein 12 n=1 Tax=Apiospora rasikravindrae TaxID=990691 RepID=A0ABR1TAK7_9PEZI
MSIDLNWDTLTGGPDGDALAESIRDFIHTKFQAVPLPRFIKSVTVHDFEFGNIPPEVVLKDICDPLPDFYEENPDADDLDDDDEDEEDEEDVRPGTARTVGRSDEGVSDAIREAERRRKVEQGRRLGLSFAYGTPGSTPPTPGIGGSPHIHTAGLRSAPGTPADMGSPFLGLSTPGIPGGTSNMHYFPSHIATGWSGTQTPLAAVASAQHLNGWLDSTSNLSSPIDRGQRPSFSSNNTWNSKGQGYFGNGRKYSQGSNSVGDVQPSFLTPATPGQPLREKHSVSTMAPTSAEASRPPTRDGPNSSTPGGRRSSSVAVDDYNSAEEDAADSRGQRRRKIFREPRVEDMQAVFRIKYSGDIKLMLTAEILLDYPMPSFVGIPVKLNITGLSFDGVGVVAYIRKRVHFCFLSPDDALTAIGDDDDDDDPEESNGTDQGMKEIKVESEIGQREGMKQSLKNVGKVERFVLEQVRRIFEEEFVYPSFWTFLV